MKSPNNIHRQVNRIIADYLTDDCCQLINDTAKKRLYKVRNIEHRYIFNINKSEGFCKDITFKEALTHDFGGMYNAYISNSKLYPRQIYAGY